MKTVAALIIFGSTLGSTPFVSAFQVPADWKEPIQPFAIVGNIYYVGTAGLGSFLITTPEGHILLDTPLESETRIVLDSIRKLGFDPKDIRILLNSQAHYDHTGGLAEIKKLSGAQMMAGRGDAELLRRGGRDDFAFGDRYVFPAVEVDRPLDDGDEIELGGTRILTRLTPGHTRGTTTYVLDVEEGGSRYRVVIAGSLSINDGVRLANPPSYEGIADDFARSFQILESLRPDVFLTAHGFFYGFEEKAARLHSGAESNPFIDASHYGPWLAGAKETFETQLARDHAAK
ncbi:MAG TPA: subclass B3 metallo-beta-lactamase [Vicinamibacteria bacterium]|nr:subclass B3 metallo-beta-lactamase [Vicinamibacteria bacterium]